jgi:hypothetical protein
MNWLVGTFNTFIPKTFLIVSRIVLNISCCVRDRGSNSSFGDMFKYISAWLHFLSVKVAIVFVPLVIMSAIKLSWLLSIWNKLEFSMNFYIKKQVFL